MKWRTGFTRSEFACKCECGFDTIDSEIVEACYFIRDHFGRPVTINSACRCESHNRSVGGSSGSQHKLGRAVDIVVEGVPAHVVQALVEEELDMGGLGRYNGFTHIDTRHGRARWEG